MITVNAGLDPTGYCSEKSLSIRAESPYENTQAPSRDAALFRGEGNRPLSRNKRSQTPQTQRSSSPHLVASHHDHHNATELCKSDDSHSPDLVSLSEQRFYNMEIRDQEVFFIL